MSRAPALGAAKAGRLILGTATASKSFPYKEERGFRRTDAIRLLV